MGNKSMKAKELAEILMQNPDYEVQILWFACDGDFHYHNLLSDDVEPNGDEPNTILIDLSDYI